MTYPHLSYQYIISAHRHSQKFAFIKIRKRNFNRFCSPKIIPNAHKMRSRLSQGLNLSSLTFMIMMLWQGSSHDMGTTLFLSMQVYVILLHLGFLLNNRIWILHNTRVYISNLVAHNLIFPCHSLQKKDNNKEWHHAPWLGYKHYLVELKNEVLNVFKKSTFHHTKLKSS